MDKSTTNDFQGQIPQVRSSLDELAREGARRMIVAALELEVDEYIQKLHHLRDENGHALVVRNGKAQARTVSLGAGPIELRAPRVDDRRARHRFTSKICQFSPGMGPPVFGYVGPLFSMTLERFQIENRLTMEPR